MYKTPTNTKAIIPLLINEGANLCLYLWKPDPIPCFGTTLVLRVCETATTFCRHRRTLHSLIRSCLAAALLPICSAISTAFSLNWLVKFILVELLEGAIAVVWCTVLMTMFFAKIEGDDGCSHFTIMRRYEKCWLIFLRSEVWIKLGLYLQGRHSISKFMGPASKRDT